MQKILFKVVPPRTKNVSIVAPGFVLEQDNWNDYSFQTLYQLSFHAAILNGTIEETHIGAVKILRRGQTKLDGLLIVTDFESLDDRFCSVGTSLDYYERLRELGEIGQLAMAALRDVIASPEFVDNFKNEQGWATSLFRDQIDHGERFRVLAGGLVSGHYAKAPVDQQSFTFKMSGWLSPVVIDTTSGEQSGFQLNCLPERVNVLIGRNGSGKSTLLARLARVAYGSPSERAEAPLKHLGTLEPNGVGFPRVVTVAFSPFDSFKLPGSDDRNRVQISKDMQRGVGRFSFLGLRDFVAEFGQANQIPSPPKLGVVEVDDRVAQTRLKSIEQLNDEFAQYRQKISEKGRQSLLMEALSNLERGLFGDDWATIVLSGSDDNARAWFHRCSTGHKITLLVVFGLVANLEPHSLVLVDEPETHLHPPLLSAMMHALRRILKEFNASAVVVTHSLVVVQESMARHVHVVRREGELTVVVPVSTETFGESIGLITAQVFGMESNATDFHEVLDRVIARYKRIEDIELLFKDGVMSQQARAYVLSRLANSAKE